MKELHKLYFQIGDKIVDNFSIVSIYGTYIFSNISNDFYNYAHEKVIVKEDILIMEYK